MRLILSRKGFDSANGGIPSPILPDGRLCPIPIPDERSPIRYEDLSVAGVPLAKLLSDLRPKRLPSIQFAHLDPDLEKTAMPRPDGWRPMFGQVGAACSHLRNQGVGIGDMFLFFGWFREVEKVEGRFQYRSNSPDRHVIYGWLQIGESWNVEKRIPAPEWVKSHVHFQRSGKKKKNELVFVSSEKLVLPGVSTSLAGGGLFSDYRPALCLTAAGQSRSVWRLPGYFEPKKGKRPLSYHGDFSRWQPDGTDVILKTTPRGQEFVLHLQNYPGVIQWTTNLLTDMVHS